MVMTKVMTAPAETSSAVNTCNECCRRHQPLTKTLPAPGGFFRYAAEVQVECGLHVLDRLASGKRVQFRIAELKSTHLEIQRAGDDVFDRIQ